ncbi:MAG: hydrogenase expression/formation C-terminal domain-containing protein, partial [Oceanobacter sp.]
LPESDELAQFPEVSELLDRLQQALETRAKDVAGDVIVLPLNELSAQACSLLYQTLGEGEVMLRVKQPDGGVLAIQESVLAGVWWIQNQNADGSLASQWLEVAAIPACVLTDSFASASVPDMPEVPAGLLNAAPVLLELLDKATAHTEQAFEQPHVINLSLLPFSPEDHAFLHEILRFGPTSILSRGYGNCRITSTGVNGIWRVQYFNSTDQLILDTLEVIAVPQVACAAREDLEDSAERLAEIHEAMSA